MLDHGGLNKWVFIRLALIALNAIPFPSSNPVGAKTFSSLELSWVFLFSLGSIPVLGFMAMKYGKLSGTIQGFAVRWPRPSWRKNPFTLTEPTQFFHLAAFILISAGISRVLVGSEVYLNPPSSGTLFLTAGVGLWAGMWLSALSLEKRKGSSPQWVAK
jgi:hypothetical protein